MAPKACDQCGCDGGCAKLYAPNADISKYTRPIVGDAGDMVLGVRFQEAGIPSADMVVDVGPDGGVTPLANAGSEVIAIAGGAGELA
jgi:hypothetical protein